jgi:hypothetical protein
MIYYFSLNKIDYNGIYFSECRCWSWIFAK